MIITPKKRKKARSAQLKSVSKTNLKIERIENYAERQIYETLTQIQKKNGSFLIPRFFGSAAALMDGPPLVAQIRFFNVIVDFTS